MGNFITGDTKIPQKGQICTIIDTRFTKEQEYPKEVFKQGMKVKVIGSKPLMCSRPDIPPVMITVVQLQDGTIDVYPSSNIAA